jgi:hypothetical protein
MSARLGKVRGEEKRGEGGERRREMIEEKVEE